MHHVDSVREPDRPLFQVAHPFSSNAEERDLVMLDLPEEIAEDDQTWIWHTIVVVLA